MGTYCASFRRLPPSVLPSSLTSQTLLSSLQYDQYKTPMENIGLQDSLLSRFDLLFIVLDQMDPEQDREISDHVLRMHRYRDPREQEGAGAVLFRTCGRCFSSVQRESVCFKLSFFFFLF